MDCELEHFDIHVNGIRLHAVQAGPGNGPLVTLLHGFPEFWRGWLKQLIPLAEAGYRVLAPDQRGYNLSEKPSRVEQYRMDALVGDVTGLLNALGREKTFLVGHDWGAAVAWETALRCPERVEKLAILNVPHLDVMSRFLLRSPRQMLKSWYIFFFQIPRLPEWLLLRRECAGLRRMMRLSSKPSVFSEADLDEYVRAWSQPGALTAMIHWYRAAFRQGVRGPWNPVKIAPRRVRLPTLMLWGKNDIALSHQMAQPSIDLCDQGELVFFENATHWVQHEEAEAVTAALLEFFAVKK